MKRFGFTIICMLLVGMVSQAQEVRIGAHIGSQLGGTIDHDVDGGQDTDCDAGFAFGVQLTHRANEAMSFELSATRFTTDCDGVDGGFDADVFASGVDITTMAATLRLGGSPSQGVYVFAGGGGNYNLVDVDDANYDNEFGYHLCAGLELPIDETAQFFVEYRRTYITFRDEATDDHMDYEFGLLRVGLNFLL